MSNNEHETSDSIDRIRSEKFRRELIALLNRFSIDDALDMPDHLLAQKLQAVLCADITYHDARLQWQGRTRWSPTTPSPGAPAPAGHDRKDEA